MSCGVQPPLAPSHRDSDSPLSSSSPMGSGKPLTAARDTRRTPEDEKGSHGTDRCPTVPTSLYPPTTRQRKGGGRSAPSEGKATITKDIHTVFSHASVSSPSHRYLLEVIQQQQERIAALRTSLLYATDYSQRASHPFSFQDGAGGEEEEKVLGPPFDPSSLPSDSLVWLEKEPSYTPTPASLLELKPSTQGPTPESRDSAVRRLDVPTASVLPLRLTLPGPPADCQKTSTADTSTSSAPVTHRVHTTPLSGVSFVYGSAEKEEEGEEEVEEEVSAAESEAVMEGAEVYCDIASPLQAAAVPTSDAKDAELLRLQKRLKALSASHLRLRLDCARQDCERRDTISSLLSMLGCVQAVLDDAQKGDRHAIPTVAHNVLEYVVRQCWRSVLSIGGGGYSASRDDAPRNDASQNDADGSPSAPTTVNIPSPVDGDRRAPMTPGIILHRRFERPY